MEKQPTPRVEFTFGGGRALQGVYELDAQILVDALRERVETSNELANKIEAAIPEGATLDLSSADFGALLGALLGADLYPGRAPALLRLFLVTNAPRYLNDENDEN